MHDLTVTMTLIGDLLAGRAPGLWPIVTLSLQVSALATLFATLQIGRAHV